MMSVTVYSMENCVQCKNTYKFLDKFGVEYSTIDIHQDPNAASILDKYSFQAAPVVVVNDGVEEDAWCGFRPEKIAALSKVSAIA